MMQWKKGDTGFEVEERAADVAVEAEERFGPGVLIDHLLRTLVVSLSRAGITSLALMVVMAVLIATVLFGLSGDEAVALGQWCRKC